MSTFSSAKAGQPGEVEILSGSAFRYLDLIWTQRLFFVRFGRKVVIPMGQNRSNLDISFVFHQARKSGRYFNAPEQQKSRHLVHGSHRVEARKKDFSVFILLRGIEIMNYPSPQLLDSGAVRYFDSMNPSKSLVRSARRSFCDVFFMISSSSKS